MPMLHHRKPHKAVTRTLISVLAATLLLGSCSEQVDTPPVASGDPEVVAGQYLVSLHPTLETPAEGNPVTLEPAYVAEALDVESLGTLRIINGFIATGVDGAALERLKADPRVRYVEPDRRYTLSASQTSSSWGLDRVDQRSLPLNGTYTYSRTGKGVTAYVIDSGIKKGLPEFGNRLAGGVSAIADGRGYDDCFGHGTHVAGTLGGKRYGVAKNVSLIAVRVFDCRGGTTTSAIVSGIDWVNFNAKRPAVANLSLQGQPSRAMDDAVNALIREGVTVVVAAGNGGQNACNVSPARVPLALTVGASNKRDGLYNDSNFGSCLDLYAPGQDIESVSLGGGSLVKSGTSMAAPHVAGTAALILEGNTRASPATVARIIRSRSSTGKISPPAKTTDRLLYSGY